MEEFEEEPEEGAPLWITTFADLMSLLMCFFVMLVAMSTLEKTTFQEMVASMKDGFGSAESASLEQHSIADVLSEAEILHAAGVARTREAAAGLRMNLTEEISKGIIEVEEGNQIITIQILQSGSFNAGSADLKKAFMPVSKRIQETIKDISGDITVAGHTDDSPIKTERFRSNWELSSARAFSVIHSLLDGGKLEPKRFVLRGFAETRPRVPNDSPKNREKNRRVEIIIDQRDEPLTEGEIEIDKLIIDATNVDVVDQVIERMEKDLKATQKENSRPPESPPKP